MIPQLYGSRVLNFHVSQSVCLAKLLSQLPKTHWILSAPNVTSNKKAVLSQRWPRDARYIRRSWAVAEIGLYDRLRRYGHLKKFFQDGGGRHLGFVRTRNSVIKSAVPEHPTLEQNMKWIGRPVAEIWPFEIFPTWRRPPSWICSNRK